MYRIRILDLQNYIIVQASFARSRSATGRFSYTIRDINRISHDLLEYKNLQAYLVTLRCWDALCAFDAIII